MYVCVCVCMCVCVCVCVCVCEVRKLSAGTQVHKLWQNDLIWIDQAYEALITDDFMIY